MTNRERVRIRFGPKASGRPAWSAVVAALALALSGLSATAAAEVTVHDPGEAFAGYNLRVSHYPPGAVLMDMDGNTLHEWKCRFVDAFPGVDVPDEPGFSDRWTNARLLPNGDVLGILGGLGLVRLDRTSRILWAHEGGEHDDLAVTEDGAIYVLGSAWNKVNWVNQKNPVLEDYVLVLGANGDVMNRVSLLSAISASDFSNITKTAHMSRSDHVLRANSLQVLDGSFSDRISNFAKGNVLVSLRGLDTIAVLDLESKTLLWTQFGMWLGQLDSTLLPGGDVLLLEYPDGDPRVIEFDPVTMEVKWTYERDSGGFVDNQWGGAVQRLPNGNTLISESGRGRAFEVTPRGDVVWEYASPMTEGARTPAPFELTRIMPEFPMDWLGN
ncbi:MAG: arylsulfotransferase family protein [Candidatus Eisenbacteria bacterium]